MNSGLDAKQLRLLVIRPTLQKIGMWSLAAERLLLATAIAESRLKYLRQLPAGPALSIYQIEPGTNADIWKNYLSFRPMLANTVWGLAGGWMAREREVIGNLYYATALARLVYRRARPPLPHPDNLAEMAFYWKEFFNTKKGKGTISGFVDKVNPQWRTSAFLDAARPGT